MKRSLVQWNACAVVALAIAAGCAGRGMIDADCEPGEYTCGDNAVLRCNAEGTEWQVIRECESDCSEGACVSDCTPDCYGAECGDDGCGGSCGTCTGAREQCIAGTCVCQPDCSGKECGDDSCGGICASCPGAQDACVDGVCVCQPDCSTKDCGDDGCEGSCGTCDTTQSFCNASDICEPCETAVCGVCDEIDVQSIIRYTGSIGGDHVNEALRPEVFTDFAVTSDLEFTFDAARPGFILHHFEGVTWRTTSNGFSDGAAMVACWHSISAGGIVCQTWEWYSPDVGIYRSFDWPANRPVAHVLISAIDEKRTVVKYLDSWPYNNVPDHFDGSDVGTGLEMRTCH